MNLTPHFTLAELTRTTHGPNEPGESEIAALRALAEHVLEPLRVALGVPVRVNSG